METVTATGSILLLLTLGLGTAGAATVTLPADARLGPVRPRLEQLVQKAADEGLPADLIVSKIREGLAKGVDAGRIESAAGALTENLRVARGFVAERRSQQASEPQLIRAVAEARMAGVDLKAADGVVRVERPAVETARAVEVLTDLSLRGYPVQRASDLLKDVLTRDPGAVGRVPSTLETVRNQQALTQAETVDAVARGVHAGAALAGAAARASDENHGRGAGGNPPGKGGGEGFVPPGQLKKQDRAQPGNGKGNSANAPGHGRGKN
jgi:hypothetical protein